MSSLERGRLLVAAPVLTDPNFDRTVVLLLEHSTEGAFGLVLNRPSEAEMPWPVDAWRGLAAEPSVVFLGGPVQPEVGFALALAPAPMAIDDDEPDVLPGVRPVSLHHDPLLFAGAGTRVRVFAGYSGWGPLQLEHELSEGAWFVVEAEPTDAFSEEPAELWWRVLRRQRNELARLANYPPDLSMN